MIEVIVERTDDLMLLIDQIVAETIVNNMNPVIYDITVT